MPKKGKGKGRGKSVPPKGAESEKKDLPTKAPEEASKEKVKSPPQDYGPKSAETEIKVLPTVQSPGETSKGYGRGRGRGKEHHPEELKQPGGFFSQQESFAAKPEVEHPEVPRTVSKKASDKLPSRESEDIMSKMAGLKLEQKPVLKFKLAKRPDYGRLGSRIDLFVNYFKLNYKAKNIYHYDVDISENTRDNKMGKSLMSEGRTAKEDIKKNVKHVERQKRRNLGKNKCRIIISEAVIQNSLQRCSPVYDGQKNLFTSQPLPYTGKTSLKVDVSIDKQPKTYYVTFQPVNKGKTNTNLIDLQPLIDLYSGHSNEVPEDILLVYETIMNHREPPFQQVQFRNAFYSLTGENRRPLGYGLDIWFGYHQSVHLTELGPVMIINLAAKAFHKHGPVINYASDVLNTDITKLPKLQRWQITSLSNALNGLMVRVTHQRFPRKYKIKKIAEKSANEIEFIENGQKINVVEYFRRKYNIKLLYPHLPCLQMQSNNNTSMPMETCIIVEGQPKIGKLDGDLTSKMIRSTAVPPDERFQSITSDAKRVKSISGRFMEAFGLLMDVNLIKVAGRIITAPQLAYAGHPDDNSRLAVPNDKGVWRIEDGKKFYKVVIIKNWVLISFADERRIGNDILSKYCDFLRRSGNKCGMQIDRPKYINIYGRNKKTSDALQDAKKSGAQFAIVVLNRRDNYHTYDEVKFLADFKYGLVTQCMEDKTLARINDQITTNVCLKINVKLGGINHILKEKPRIFSKPVMVIGADAIHWIRGHGYPSIVAVVASLNPSASRYALTCHTQRNDKEGKISQEIIKQEKMIDIATELLEAFNRENRIYPLQIIVFRDGVSDGQFQHALEQEVSGIQRACQNVNGKIVPITFICVQKRHQTRFRPVRSEQGIGRQRNVPPGTTVDKDITHPTNFDYFICSHEGIQGTSKPAHYTVLHNDSNLKSDELQQLCYFLCHTYVRCTRSVSLPAPVLYADLAAFRAKRYADLHISADDVSSHSGEIEREFPREVESAIKQMRSFENNMFYI